MAALQMLFKIISHIINSETVHFSGAKMQHAMVSKDSTVL